MPNGINLYGNYSTTQILIVPKPNSSSIFYIFTASAQGNSNYTPVEKRGFHYSIVDMTLDGGLGDVVTKNILLTSSTTEKMAAINHVNGVDVWVVMHEWDSRKFRSYLVTVNGISETPIISETGTVHTGPSIEFFQESNSIGQMKISPNGEKLALVTYYNQKLEIFNFDPSNGMIRLLSSISLGV
jgi:hypothetical protein